MDAKRNKNGNYEITKGRISFEILNGQDRWPYFPTRIVYEGTCYPLKIGLLQTINEFKKCYSEEQVFDKLFELTQNN